MRISSETSGFLNYIDEYIYFAPEPTDGPLGLNETIRGTYQVFTFRPVDAVFYGAEHAFRLAPPRWPVSIDGQLSVVRARDVTNRGFLVFVPPGRYRLGVTYHWPEVWRLRNGYVSVGGTVVDRQRRYELSADFAPPPPAYFLLGAAAGVELPIGDQVLSVGRGRQPHQRALPGVHEPATVLRRPARLGAAAAAVARLRHDRARAARARAARASPPLNSNCAMCAVCCAYRVQLQFDYICGWMLPLAP